MMQPHREEPASHLVTREVKIDDSPHDDVSKKSHEDTKDKEPALEVKEEKSGVEAIKSDESSSKKSGDTADLPISGSKRPRDSSDNEAEKPEVKKLCLEESTPLEGDLSDISDDDADEILNREDSEIGAALGGETAVPVSPAVAVGAREVLAREPDKEASEREEKLPSAVVQEINLDSRTVLMSSRIEERQQDEETMDNLDFEEISDEELDPEESKTGIGDALGVDWASLVAESRPRTRSDSTPGSARRRWESCRVLARLGVSVRYGGQDLVDSLKAKYNVAGQNTEKEGDGKENASPQPENGATAKDETLSLCFLHPVASIHVALRERQARRKALFASSGPYKRALSARRDLAIRRQLCNLPVKETTGDSQQPGPDIEIYRLGVQLFERSL
jgi:hypothetical protein